MLEDAEASVTLNAKPKATETPGNQLKTFILLPSYQGEAHDIRTGGLWGPYWINVNSSRRVAGDALRSAAPGGSSNRSSQAGSRLSMTSIAPLRNRLKARLALVREDLEEVLGRLTDSDLDWAPAPGMRTVGGQLQEIVGTEQQNLAMLGLVPKQPCDEIFQQCKRGSLQEYRDLFSETRTTLLVYLDSLPDDELDAPIEMPANWFESLKMGTVPRGEAIRSIAQHEWYHVGQLVSYLWMRGDNPYKW